MSVTVNFIIALILHVMCLVAYPYTGKLGFAYLFISLLIWTAMSIFFKAPVSHFNRSSALFFNILFVFVMLVSLLTMTPQEDSVSILNKLIKGQYPDKRSYYHGLLRLGIYDKKLLREIIKEEGRGKNTEVDP